MKCPITCTPAVAGKEPVAVERHGGCDETRGDTDRQHA